MSKYLKNEFDLHTISTGDILRDHIKNQTSVGLQVRSIMEAGGAFISGVGCFLSLNFGLGLVPDCIMMELVREAVQGPVNVRRKSAFGI